VLFVHCQEQLQSEVRRPTTLADDLHPMVDGHLVQQPEVRRADIVTVKLCHPDLGDRRGIGDPEYLPVLCGPTPVDNGTDGGQAFTR